VTVVVEETQTTRVQESSQNTLAPWQSRAGAFALDVFPGLAVIATMGLVSRTVPSGAVWWWACISVIGAVFLLISVNRLLLPTITGWSLGRALFGIAVVRRDGEEPGPWTLLLRELAHLLDTASVVGWLWPLWDSRRRTFADLLVRTEARRLGPDRQPPGIRRWSMIAVSAAAGLCLAGAATGYGVVYSQERGAEQAIAQLKTQGPKIVAQMLTYDPKSLDTDFARARSLATDKYRTQLTVQQDVVKNKNPVINEYWVTNNSVEAASPDRATMLMFMQGRRGVDPQVRYISATVRVTFAKEGDDQWRVDDLTVLTKPSPSGGGK
jgi:Mce-associated membrane protein